jgi:hypothetical protein
MGFPKSSAFGEDHPAQRVVVTPPERSEVAATIQQPGFSEVPTAVLEEWSHRLRESANALDGRTSHFHTDGLDQLAAEVESYLRG